MAVFHNLPFLSLKLHYQYALHLKKWAQTHEHFKVERRSSLLIKLHRPTHNRAHRRRHMNTRGSSSPLNHCSLLHLLLTLHIYISTTFTARLLNADENPHWIQSPHCRCAEDFARIWFLYALISAAGGAVKKKRSHSHGFSLFCHNGPAASRSWV